jgi:hypothetical protein
MRWLVGVLIVALLVAGGYTSWRWRQAEAAKHELRIQIANDSAARDTTVLEIRADADSQIAVARRVAFQTEVELREAFQDTVERVAHAAARIRIERDSLQVELEGERAEKDTAGTVTAKGRLDARDSLGIAVSATVAIPRDLLKPIWSWRLWRDPIPLELALSCEEDLAVAQLAGPPWARLAIDSVAQDPDICLPAPDLGWNPFRFELPSLPWAIVLVAIGYGVAKL